MDKDDDKRMGDSEDLDSNDGGVGDNAEIDFPIDKNDGEYRELSRLERHHRRRIVRATKVFFKAIDILFKQTQNSCPYLKNKIVKTIECQNDVVYDEASPKEFSMDVYRVPSDKIQPAVVIIHGGGFSAGDKRFRRALSQYFAINGFTVFTVNYGLSPKYVFPEPIEQLIKAIGFISDNSENFGIDKNRIIVEGDSAGAYYASIMGAVSTNERYAECFKTKVNFRVLGTILNCGLYELNSILASKYILNVDNGVFLSFTGLNKKELTEYKYKDICMPFEYVTKDYPPSFVIYSPADSFCKEQGGILCERLESLGAYCEYFKAKRKTSNHCFSLNWRGEDAVVANALMMSFAKRLAEDKIKF